MPKWYKYILIICDVFLLALILLYSYIDINKFMFDDFSNAVFILLLFLLIYGISFFIIVMVVVSFFLKFKNLVVLIFSLVIIVISVLFSFYGSNITNSIFCDKAIRVKLNEVFGDDYKIVAKKKEEDNYIYDVYLNNNDKAIFNSKVDMNDSCMWSINCKYILYTNYREVYLKYYLNQFNSNTSNSLVINIKKYSNKLKKFNSMINLELKCNDMNCTDSYNDLLEFKKYLLNNQFNIDYIYITFYSLDNKRILYKRFLELDERYNGLYHG